MRTLKSAGRLARVTCLLAFAMAAGCTAAEKSEWTKAFTGHPAATQPATQPADQAAADQEQPTGNSIEGVTEKLRDGASTVAAFTPPGTPPNSIASLVAALAGLALVLERGAVYVIGKIPNSESSASNLASTGAAGTGPGNPPSTSTQAPAGNGTAAQNKPAA